MDFWAQRGKSIVGPFPTREEALAIFRERFPVKSKPPHYKKDDIMTGYGSGGPWFDIRWDSAS